MVMTYALDALIKWKSTCQRRLESQRVWHTQLNISIVFTLLILLAFLLLKFIAILKVNFLFDFDSIIMIFYLPLICSNSCGF